MKIIVNKNSKSVDRVFSEDTYLVLSESSLTGDVRSVAYNSNTHELYSNVDCEQVYVPGVYTYENGVITIIDHDTHQQAFAARLQQEVIAETQKRLDDFARTRNYDGILSLCTYATSTNVKFQTEGQYGVQARDNTWATLYEILDEVQSGTRPMPSSYADIEPELPVLSWPN